jgi:predicted house-cleaning noncanonical NTP pyrophosphatase (MazG superfamily)
MSRSTKYNKLVRDYIPHILQQQGLKFTIHTVSGDEYLTRLQDKLQEEVAEYIANPCLEELADITEVIYALVRAQGHEPHAFTYELNHKRRQRGGFEKGIVLEKVKE